MVRGLADTSVFIAREVNRPLRNDLLPDSLAISVVTVGELRAGVLAAPDLATRDRRLVTLGRVGEFAPLPIDERVAESWARLRVALRDSGRPMPVNDSWIAATAIAQQIPVVTQDDDYADVPGLEVIRV